MQTGWVLPPRPISGLDQLGTQSPCTLIYSQLLPGITNVTDRARYYSLYPWLVRSLDKRLPHSSEDIYVEYYRRADCLLTLIAERHGRRLSDPTHGQAMIGRLQLVPALTRLEDGEELKLSVFATREDGSEHRYFQNRLGGLGQYYAGQLAELRILNTSGGKWVTYTEDGGTPLAIALETLSGVDLFWKTVESDVVTTEILDNLTNFCICGLGSNHQERDQLLDLFFARTQFSSQRTASGNYDSLLRRDSLRLLLHLADSLASKTSIRLNEDSFRGAVYTGFLSTACEWTLPDDLQAIRALWSLYERNDLLSMAFLAVFTASLQALDRAAQHDSRYRSVEKFAAVLSSDAAVQKSINDLLIGDELAADPLKATFSDLVQYLDLSQAPLRDWQNEAHEITLAAALLSKPATGSTYHQALSAALRLLALLAARTSSFPSGYGDLVLSSGDLGNYPINLISFEKRTKHWCNLPLTSVLDEVLRWTLNTHLSVALRKLRQTRQSSFHVQPTEAGLQTVGTIPSPVSTLPRIRQALQILADTGALVPVESPNSGSESGFAITDLGRTLLEGSNG